MAYEQGILVGMIPDRTYEGSDIEHPLALLGLSTRAHNALLRQGILTVEQLAELSEDDLWHIRQAGAKTVAEIKEALAAWEPSLSLAPTEAKPPPPSAPPLWEVWSLPTWLAEDHTPLGDLNLKVRTFRTLYLGGLRTVRQVAMLSLSELSSIWQIGLGSIENIRQSLTEYATAPGRSPAPPPPDPTRLEEPPSATEFAERRYTFADIVALWLEEMRPRDRVALERHFGLDSQEPQTLQDIGQDLGITRERVRQLIKKACSRLGVLKNGRLTTHVQALRRYLDAKDGLASAEEIRKDLDLHLELAGFDALTCSRILAEIDDELDWLTSLDLLCHGSTTRDQVLLARRELRKLCPDDGAALPVSQLSLACAASGSFQRNCGQMSESFLLACLRTDPEVVVADGLITWSSRATKWKQRLISALQEMGAPAHYSDITIKVNETSPEDDQVGEHHVHAVLQRYTEVFIRTGRGIYGLLQWDRPSDDLLANAVYDLLDTQGQPLTAKEIAARLSATHPTAVAAVQAVLTASPRFHRVGRGIYGLAGWRSTAPDTLADVVVRVLTEAAQPLSLKDITDRVLAIRHGAASSMSAILANDTRIARVRRGTYALATWISEGWLDIEQEVAKSPLTAAEAIIQVLSTAGKPLVLKDIAQAVCVLRPVAYSTISMTLAKDSRIRRIDKGYYGLAEWNVGVSATES